MGTPEHSDEGPGANDIGDSLVGCPGEECQVRARPSVVLGEPVAEGPACQSSQDPLLAGCTGPSDMGTTTYQVSSSTRCAVHIGLAIVVETERDTVTAHADSNCPLRTDSESIAASQPREFASPRAQCDRDIGCTIPAGLVDDAAVCLKPASPKWETFQDPDVRTDAVQENPPTSADGAHQPSEPEPRMGRDYATEDLESLLDDIDIVSEFRMINSILLGRFACQEAIVLLVGYLVREHDHLPEMSQRQRPYVSFELLGTDSMMEVMLQAERDADGKGPVNYLWDFLEAEPARYSSAIFAGYACPLLAALFHRDAEVIARTLTERGPAKILAQLLHWIEFRCVAELLALLIYADGPASNVLPFEVLISPMLDVLSNQTETSNDACAEHVALAMDALFTKALIMNTTSFPDGGTVNGQLLSRLTSPSVLTALIDLVAHNGGHPGKPSAILIHSGTVLSNAVQQLFQISPNPLLPCRLSSPQFADVRPAEGTPVSSNSTMASGPTSNDGTFQGVHFESGRAVVAEICARLDDLCCHLPCATIPLYFAGQTNSDEYNASVPSLGNSRCGPVALEIVRVLVTLARTGCQDAFDAFAQFKILKRCILALFACPWSSVFHNAIRAVFIEVTAHREQGAPLVSELLLDAGLMEQVVGVHRKWRLAVFHLAADAAEATCDNLEEPIPGETQESQNPKTKFATSCDVGYLGPLLCILSEIHGLAQSNADVAAALQTVPGWRETVEPELVAMETLQSLPLGGPPQTVLPRPADNADNFDCLAAVRGAVGELSEVELNLEDIRDVNEDFDVMLDMADVHRRRRAKQTAKESVEQDELEQA